jgi:hypothetical protein
MDYEDTLSISIGLLSFYASEQIALYSVSDISSGFLIHVLFKVCLVFLSQSLSVGGGWYTEVGLKI